MERGISIMDNEGLPLIGFSGGALQGLPAFFFLVNDLDVGILGKGQPGTGASLESVSAPLQSLPSLQKLEDDSPEIGIGGSFTGGQGAQGENVDRHAHDLYFNNKLVDLTTDMLFNILVSRKGEAQGTVTPKASLLTPNFSQRGATDMLSPVKGVYQHAQVFFPLTPSAGAVINLPLTRPGSLSLSREDLCPFCDGLAVWEEASETWGDIIHQEHVCPECNGTGLSLLGLIESGLAGEPDRYPAELEALEA